ncbi:unnamed protein product [Nezara viridula]|uniref:Uncharacterized protein n=1 Tax=Nezara viridula TaxID=85310 RepID=A0A9P0MT48_NEZVI|nr:unnamed protein product [Nezara viridula]
MFYFCLVTVLFLAQQIGKSEAAESCFCAPMDSKNITKESEPLIKHPLKVLKDCGKEAEQVCLQLCKSLATLAQYDPNAGKSFCAQLNKNITNIHISIFSKVCDGEYLYTGLTFNKPLCCTNKKSVPC